MFPEVVVLFISEHFILDDLIFAALKGRWYDIDVYFSISNNLYELTKLLYLLLLFALTFDRLHGCSMIVNVNIINLVIIFIKLDVVISRKHLLYLFDILERCNNLQTYLLPIIEVLIWKLILYLKLFVLGHECISYFNDIITG